MIRSQPAPSSKVCRAAGPALARVEAGQRTSLYLTHHQRDHKSLSSPFQAAGSTKLYLLHPDTIQSPRTRPGTLIRRLCKWSNRMEPKFTISCALTLQVPYQQGRLLDYLPFQRGLLWPRPATVLLQDLWFHVTLSTECSVHFQHKFNCNYDPINIWEE